MNEIGTGEEDQHIIRMDEHMFNELLNLVAPHIKSKNTKLCKAPSAKVKLEIALRFLANGESFVLLWYNFCTPELSISVFLPIKGHQISTFSLSGLYIWHVLCYTNIRIYNTVQKM